MPAVGGGLAAVRALRRNGRHGVAFSFPTPPLPEVTGEIVLIDDGKGREEKR